MTTQVVSTPAGHAGRRLVITPALAGVAYAVSWVAALVIAPVSLSVAPTGAEIVAGYAGHTWALAVQWLLSEAVAGVLLAVVAIALGRSFRDRRATVAATTGVLAGTISFGQAALGMAATVWAAPSGRASAAEVLVQASNRLDGVKMLVLAVMAGAGVLLTRRPALLPRWLGYVGAALAVTIAVSGVGYLLLSDALAPVAYVSLPLLLIFVTGSGIVVAKSRR